LDRKNRFYKIEEIQLENAVKQILEHIGEDPSREGLIDTPTRVRKAWEFMTSGYKEDPKEIIQKALFTSTNDEMVVVKDIEFYSHCEHHMLSIIGKAHVAYIPNGTITGLSKIARVVDVFARRLQIQERLTTQIKDCIQDTLKPLGVAVVIEAQHLRMQMRGIQKQHSITTTSDFTGAFQKEATRDEFIKLISTKFS